MKTQSAAEIQAFLISSVAELRGLDARSIDPRERFSRYGLDSLAAARLLAALSEALGRPLHPTLVWEQPTIEALSRYLTGGQSEPSAPRGERARMPSESEPIAIVGLSCRFPKAPNAAAFWQLLSRGVDAISEVPKERWDIDALYDADPTAPGKMSTRWGGFLEQVDRWDAEFFGISPREAIQVDPQQRLMLELAWEALEDAGLSPSRLKGSRTGVFVGAMWSDYAKVQSGGRDAIVQHTATGQDLSIVPARISYALGLQGPSVAVNTACSSSLVAIHLACQSLRSGEASLALAGGVNLILSPESTITMSKFGAMAPDGRSKAFDARANGYVRGEGGGVVVLKPLSRAIADGDPIYCVLRGSAVNNDGFSNGLTAPNPQAQEAVLRDAYEKAGVAPEEVQYVEAHGTGTLLGDPIEARALGAVLGVGRPAGRPLHLGSVKTNIGHLEAAAGVAGLIKVALAMKHRLLPPSLHYREPNPHIAFEELRLQVQQSLGAWPDEARPALAGVSSFGFGGTNCHLVVQEVRATPVHLLPLSAESPAALRALAQEIRALAAAPEPRPALPELCAMAAARGAPQDHRLALTVRSRVDIEAHLESFLEGRARPGMASGCVEGRRSRLVFVFGGQGSQWIGMGRDLLREEPAFGRAMRQCEQAMRPYLDWSLLAELSSGGARLLEDSDVVQPVLFAIQVSLAALWRSWGIEPDAVVGQSMGEVAAACVAGALSLEDAARVICRRSQLVKQARGRGGMAVVELSLAETARALEGYEGRLSVAVSTSPKSTVVSGDSDALEELAARLREDKVSFRQIKVDYASHSPHMDELRTELLGALEGIRPRPPEVPFYSTVTGTLLEGAALDAAYWARNLREPVLFTGAFARLLDAGHDLFLELDPHPLLAQAMEESLACLGREGTVLPSLRREEDGRAVLLDSLGALYTRGRGVEWPRVFSFGPLDAPPGAATDAAPAELLALSAHGPEALRDLARAMSSLLAAQPELPLHDLCYTASVRRHHHAHRLAAVGRTREELCASLEAFGRGEPGGGVMQGEAQAGARPKVVFVFPGQGSQWVGMGRQLLEEEPVFRSALEACDQEIAREAGFSVLEELHADATQSKLGQIDIVQPTLFAIEVALSALWRSWGVEPDVVVGHSMGEVAAAHVVGALTLEQATQIICRRSRLLRRMSGQGAMAQVELSLSEAEEAIRGYEDRLSVAVSNSPRSTVLSGEPGALDEVVERLTRANVFCRSVKVDVASHSPQMDPLREELLGALAALSPRAATVAMYSTVTGRAIEGAELDAAYWAQNLRAPVLFSQTTKRLIEEGYTLFVEISPHPILLPAIEEGLQHGQREGAVRASLRREQEERRVLLSSLGALYARGYPVDWERLYPSGGRCVPLPTYPWQRQRYWIDARRAARGAVVSGHPLLGVRVPMAGASAVFETALGITAVPYLSDHRVLEQVVVPAAVVLELAHAAAHVGAGRYWIKELVLHTPLVLSEAEERRVQVVLSEETAEGMAMTVYSQASVALPDEGWTEHAAGQVQQLSGQVERAAVDLAAARARCRRGVSVAELYATWRDAGLAYGPAFQRMVELWCGEGEAVSRLVLPAEAAEEAQAYALHPALLDAALQTLSAALGLGAEAGADVYMPFEVGSFIVWQPRATAAWVHAWRTGATDTSAEVVSGDVTVVDERGEVLAEVSGLRFKRAEATALRRAETKALSAWLYQLTWQEVTAARTAKEPAGTWLVLTEDSALGEGLVERLRSAGARCIRVDLTEDFARCAAEALARALAAVDAEGSPLEGVICLWGAGRTLAVESTPADRVEALTTAGLSLVQALAGREAPIAPRLLWVTEGAQAVHPGEAVAVAEAPLWGLGRVVMKEHPELRCMLVDLETGAADAAKALWSELCAADGETQVAWRAGKRHAPRLVKAAAERERETPPLRVAESTVLITGGLGALGLHMARWLWEEHHVGHLLLVGRSAPEGERLRAVEALQAAGARVTVAQADVADASAVRALISAVPAELPLRGVIHAAAVLDDGVLRQQNATRFARVLSPKVRGAWNLHVETRERPLDFLVMFSSLSSLLGPLGHSSYAAANAFLDALAQQRRSEGLPAQSLNWGMWSGDGMFEKLDAAQRTRLTRQGAGTMSPAEALALLEQALSRPEAQLVVLRLDMRALQQALGGEVPPMWRALLAARAARLPTATASGWAARLAELAPEARTEEMEAAVRVEVAKVLLLGSSSALSAARPLKELGLDSVMAVELRNALAARVGKVLPATLVFNYPTVAALTRHLLDQMQLTRAASAAAPVPVSTHAEPIAIVGIGCRYPGGVRDPDSFWRLLEQGVDAIEEVPKERWDIDAYYDPDPDAPGKMTTRWGGFLEGVDQFDPGFFEISPREAVSLDPQQRLLLEVSWEALERAGQTPERLLGSDTGVYMGLYSNDYQALERTRTEVLDPYLLLGTMPSTGVARLSYWLGLKGPNMPVDTACSSSLVAVHLACQALRAGECSLSLAGGVNLLLTPEVTACLSGMRAMSPTGRCHTFSADADGFVRSEGCGVVVLKRLSDAQRDGDPILAVIRGSAVNQDGRSNGLTAPNGPSQEAVIRRALSQAGVAPSAVGYVETHGTGTPLGDPIEVQALGAVLGEGRSAEQPVVLGSVKTNVGHTEGASGIAGLIKAVLALQHGSIPKSLHFTAPNPHIPWEGLKVLVAAKAMPWPVNGSPRIAGVSAFGLSGTNAHVVLEEAPRAVVEPAAEEALTILPLSAKSPEALAALAQTYGGFLAGAGTASGLRDIAYTASVRRGHHAHRLAVVGRSRAELCASLEAFGRGDACAGVVQGEAKPGARPKVVFVYPGQGSQWVGMGRALLEEEPVFRTAIEACDEAIRAEAGFSLLEELRAEASSSKLEQIDVIQPALFAMAVALSALWRSWGVEPDAVVGHSMGEVAAAHVAGALTLPDAARIICRRSRLLRRVSGQGAMALVELSREEAEAALAGYEDRLSVAVSNSSRSTVLSGEPGALSEVLERLSQRSVFSRRVKVDVASHSPQMDGLRGELLEALSGLRPSGAQVPMYSTVTGAVSEGAALDAAYWVRNLREPVLFAQSVQQLLDQGHGLFVEMSPHPLLLPAIEEGLRESDRSGVALPSLRREQEERRELLASLGALYAHGHGVDWKRLYPAGGRSVPLPSYPFQRERYWLETAVPAKGSSRGVRASREGGEGHPLLGGSFTVAAQPGAHFWEQTVGIEALPYLSDHRVEGEAVLPGAAYVEMALAAAAEVYGEGARALEQVAFERMLVLPAGGARTVQVMLTKEESGRASFQVSSREETDETWVRHATGSVRVDEEAAKTSSRGEAPRAIQERSGATRTGAEHYQRMGERGLDYGPCFQGVEQLWLGADEVLGRVRLPDVGVAEALAYQVHPALLDACFQVLGGLFLEDEATAAGEGTFVPVGLERMRVERRPGREVWVHGRRRGEASAGVAAFTGDLRLMDGDGELLGEARGLRVQPLSPGALGRRDPHEQWLYALAWRRKDHEPEAPASKAPPSPGAFLVWMDRGETGAALCALLQARGEGCVRVIAGERYARLEEGLYQVDPADPEAYRTVLREAFGPERPCRGVMHLWSLDATAVADTTVKTLEADQRLGSLSALYLAQALVRAGWRDPPRLVVVTRGAQAVGAEVGAVEVSQAPVWGLGRTLAFEHPELGCTRVDLSPEWRAEEAPALLRELVSSDGEDQIALRAEGRYVARLVRSSFGAKEGTAAHGPLERAGERPFRLEITEPGVLERLTLREMERRPPGPGEVEIEVEAAGLNFLDVLLALGALPDDAAGAGSAGPRLGGECAGRIVAVGEGVTSFQLGQEVLGLATTGSFGSFVTTQSALVVPKPVHLDFAQAAALPIAFVTAYYALAHVGRLRKSERVLIHAGAGGVGLAAIQWAKHVGAEVFATAGSEEKRSLLRSLGVAHVMDSRSLRFAEDVMGVTKGEGVDVVLNSLSGEFIATSLKLLRDHGRFVEIGKRDYYENHQLGLRPFLKNLSFSLVDLRGMILQRPEVVSSLLEEVMGLFEASALEPLPCRSFPISQAAEAFSTMAQARHVGKIVLSLRDGEARIAPRTGAGRPSLRAEGSYLITGGLGGLGLSVAQWMVGEGARHVVLVGRSGASAAARAAIGVMEEAGAEVLVVSADVSRRAEVERVLAEIEQHLPPLRGIVHAAAVLDDRMALELSREPFARVMAPKVQGAWNLHALTLDKPLDFFVLYSSAASLLGSPGQGNYAAANAFLDALAHHRRRLGLCGLSINWGPFSEVGLAAAQQNRGERLLDRGMRSLTPAQGVEVLGRLLSGEQTQVGVLDLNLRQWLEFYPSAAGAPLWSELLREDSRAKPGAVETSGFQKMLLKAAPGERPVLLEKQLGEELGRVLRLPASRIDRQATFSSLGVDSLMSLEFRNRLESSLGRRFSATLLFTYPDLASLVEKLLGQIDSSVELSSPPPRKENKPASVDLPERIEDLGKDELLALFEESIGRIETENQS